MPITVVCPGCATRLNAPDSAAGRNAKCPKCRAALAVPVSGSVPPAFEVVDEPPSASDAPPGRERRKTPVKTDVYVEEEDRPRKRSPRGHRPEGRAARRWLPVAGVALLAVAAVGILAATGAFSPRPPAVAKGGDTPAPPGPAPVLPPGPVAPAPATPPGTSPPPAVPEPPAAPVKGPAGRPPPPSPADPLRPHLVFDAWGHTALVTRVAVTPDGRRVVTASRDRTIRVWDAATGETLRTFRFPAGPDLDGIVQGLALSPDGRLIAAAVYPVDRGKDGFPVFVVEPDTGRLVTVVKGHRDAATAVAFSRDGRFLATGSADKHIAVFDTRSWKPLALLRGHTDHVVRVTFSPDGVKLLSVGEGGLARLWTGDPKQRPFFELADGDHRARSVAWSPDGKTVAVGNHDGTISLWNPDATLRRTLTGLRNEVLWMAFTPDGREILQGGIAPGTLNRERYGCTLVDIESGKERSRFEEHANVVSDGCLSGDGKLAVTAGGEANEVYLWRTADASLVQTFAARARDVWAVGWSPDGRSVAWGHTNTAGWERNLTPLERTFHLGELRFGGRPTADYRRAVLTRGDRTLELTENREMAVKRGGRTVLTFRDYEMSAGDEVTCFTWLPDGRIVVGSVYGLHLFDPDTNRIVRTYHGSTDKNFAVALSPDPRYFLTVSGDMTLRVWDVEHDQPLLSLFAAGTDWVAWTREGIYAASPNGERLMGWQVNTGGANGLGTAYAAAQFRKSLYLPEVVRQVLPCGGVPAALAKAGVAASPDVSRLLPPAVAITKPGGLGLARFSSTKFELRATARSVGSHPVTALGLLVNGRPYSGAGGRRVLDPPKTGEAEVTWEVELPPGTYNLAVAAESPVSRSVSAPVEVQVVGEGSDSRPDLYVLAVGVNEYPDPMKLRFAAPDADAIAKAFRDQGRRAFRRVEVRLLKDKQATRGEVEKGLDWLAGKMTHRDVGVVFFSGHGGREKDGELYLITADVDPKDVPGTCLPGALLKRKLADTPGRVVAILDACHSGAAGDRPAEPVATDDLVRELVSEQYGIVVMSSSQGWEYSLEGPAVKQGFFTAGLVEGLSGKADANGDGVVYLNELDAYASRRVRELSGGRQNPVTARPPAVRTFPLSQP